MGQPALNIVKAICSLITALIYAPFAYMLLTIFSPLCRGCDSGALWLPVLCAGWFGPAAIIFLILVEVDKPSPWEFLRPLRVLKRGSIASYGLVLIALLVFLGFEFGHIQSMVSGFFTGRH